MLSAKRIAENEGEFGLDVASVRLKLSWRAAICFSGRSDHLAERDGRIHRVGRRCRSRELRVDQEAEHATAWESAGLGVRCHKRAEGVGRGGPRLELGV